MNFHIDDDIPKDRLAKSLTQEHIKTLQPDQRVAFIHWLTEGWCKECGYEDPKNDCACRKDW